MQLRVFEAADTGQAMARMREALGPDAVLVASVPTSRGVRLTAAAEVAETDLAALLTPPDAESAGGAIAAVLARHGTPAELAAELAAAAAQHAGADTATLLTQALASRLRFEPIAWPLVRPLVLVGPHGAGKTAATARLAVDALLQGHELAVATTDTARAGGTGRLQALLEPVGRSVVPAADATALARLAERAGPGLVVDTAGLDAFRLDEVARLADLVRAAGAEPVLVLPAGLDAGDSADIAANLSALGVRRLLATRLDAARRLGGLLAAAGTGLAFAGASIGPAVGRGTTALAASGLARLLLRRAPPGVAG